MSKIIIDKTIEFVKETLENAPGCHDWFHIMRVWNNAKLIGKNEDVDMLVVELWALLHDIAEPKFHNWDETIGPKVAGDFLQTLDVEEEIIKHVQNIIQYVSFKNSFWDNSTDFESKELEVVQDADRIDAIWAIWITRTFAYGGSKNRSIYNPDIQPNLNMTKQEYKNSTAPTINHFYEKLLLLKNTMNTESGKEIAQQRHDYMQWFLEQFYAEWNGEK